MLQDLHYGLRALRRTPAFALTAIATLSLGIGAVSTVLALGDALLFRPLPVSEPSTIVEIVPTRARGTTRGFASYPDYAHFREAGPLEDLAAYYPTAPLFVAAGSRAQEVTGSVVTWNFLRVIGVDAARGRLFAESEDRVPGRDPVAVVSDVFWRGWLGGSPGAIGARIDVNGVPFTIVGILPPDFSGLHTQPTHVYIPAMMLAAGYRWCEDAFAADCTILRMLGRLPPGGSVEAVQARLAASLPERWTNASEGENSGVRAEVPRGAGTAADRRMVGLLAAVSGLLLLICCANLAALLSARGAARARELATRISLGATRLRLARQLLIEPALLALAGGALGLGLSLMMAHALERWFFSLDGAGRPLLLDFSPEPRTLAAVAAVTCLTGLLSGLAPALAASRGGVAGSLERRSATTAGPSRAGRRLLGAQIACAVVLVSTAGLLASSAYTLAVGRGFDPSRVAQVRLRPRLAAYPPERAQPYLRDAIDRLTALPGVEAVSLAGTGGLISGIEADVRLPGAEGAQLRTGCIEIGPRYFAVLGTSVLRGREFDSADRAGAPAVAIVSRSLARALWNEEAVLDRIIVVDDQPRRIVGVVEDVRLQTRAEPIRPYVFLPFWQNPEQVDARLAVRVAGDPEAMLPTLARAVHEVDPAVPVSDVAALPALLAGSFRPVRMSAVVATYAGLLAVLVCAIGLYGALAFAVVRRTREIGIRVAVGADPRRIVRTILGEAAPVIVAGVGSGLILAAGAARVLGHVLAAAAANDAIVHGAAALLVAGVAVAAGWMPARRAARIEPTVALRLE